MTEPVKWDAAAVARLTRDELVRLWHEAPAGHPVFVCGSALYQAFEDRRKALKVPTLRVERPAGFSENTA